MDPDEKTSWIKRPLLFLNFGNMLLHHELTTGALSKEIGNVSDELLPEKLLSFCWRCLRCQWHSHQCKMHSRWSGRRVDAISPRSWRKKKSRNCDTTVEDQELCLLYVALGSEWLSVAHDRCGGGDDNVQQKRNPDCLTTARIVIFGLRLIAIFFSTRR